MEWNPCRTGQSIEYILAREQGPIVLISPFVKVKALKRLCAEYDVPVTLYTRWMPHEVAAGISDLEVLDVILETGGDVRLHPRLHAKLYLRGFSAMAGSANTTLTGLGFSDPAAVELLVPVALPSEPITALLDLLDRTTPRATQADRAAVAARAAQVDLGGLPFQRDVNESYPQDIEPSPLIEFRDPQVAWAYYSRPDEHDPVLVRKLLRSLAGLGVPPWLETPGGFEAAIGGGMRQGVHGRVIRECQHLPAYAAVTRYRQIMGEVGIDIPDEQADESWRTFCYWAQHFVPEIQLRPTQVGF